MESLNSAPVVSLAIPQVSRRHYRQRVHGLAYVHVDEGNGGIIRDLSETGIALHTLAALRPGQSVALRFELTGPRVKVEAAGRVAWATAMGQAGIEFTSISSRSQRSLKEWIFIQLLTMAHSTAWGSMFGQAEPVMDTPAASTLANEPIDQEEASRTAWLPAAAQAIAIDGMIVAVGTLIFAMLALAFIGISPPWQQTALIMTATVIILGLLYAGIFRFSLGPTPGQWLAGVEKASAWERREPELDRFR